MTVAPRTAHSTSRCVANVDQLSTATISGWLTPRHCAAFLLSSLRMPFTLVTTNAPVAGPIPIRPKIIASSVRKHRERR